MSRFTPLLFSLMCVLVACSPDTGTNPSTPSPVPQSADLAIAHDEPPASPEPVAANPMAEAPAPAESMPGDQSTALTVLDISERDKDGKNGLAVTFSTPLDTARDIQPYFSVTDVNGEPVAGAWVLGDKRKLAWFMQAEPNQTYQVKVSPGLRTQNGGQLLAAASATIKTRRLQPSVNFDSDGMVLPVGYGSGLPVVSVNIAAVDVDFFRVSDANISEFMMNVRRNGRQSWYARNLKSLGELAYSGRFDLAVEKNTRSKRDLAIQRIDALQKAGLYLAIMRPAGDYSDLQITWFTITDIGLHLRHYHNQLDVHASSLTSAAALSGVELEILDNENRVIESATTTPDGVASFTGTLDNAQVLVARSKSQVTLLDLRRPALDLSEFDLGARPQLANELFIYGPRDLYRPGEAATFSALLRNHDGRLGQTPVLNAELHNPQRSVVKRFRWQAQSQGYYQYDFVLPANAPTGKWELVVKGMLQKPVVYAFNVEEFLPERMKLTLAEGAKRSLLNSPGARATLPVLGEYLYGAPAAGNKFDGLVQISHWRSPLKDLDGFQFGDLNDTAFTPQEDVKPVVLDGNGKAEITLPNLWRKAQSPLEIRVVGNLYESGGRPVTRAHSFLFWPNAKQPGVRPQFGDTNPASGSNAAFDVVLVNAQGERFASAALKATLIKEDRQYFWEYSNHRGWHWNWSEKEFPVASEPVSTSVDGVATVSFPVEWGNYRLEVTDSDSGVKTSVRFFAGYNWYYDWTNARDQVAARPDKVTLALDKPAYAPGDVARLKILPPAAGEVLVLVESDVPLWSKKITVDKAGAELEIPVDAAWDSHDIYISALLLQPSAKKIRQTPKRALGLIYLPLDREPRRLDIAIDTPDTVLPATTLPVRVHLDSASGTRGPASAQVTVAAVDVGVLNISDFATPDAFDYFFGQRRYSVDARDMFADVIELQDAQQAEQRFGGDADLARGGKQPQSDVQIVSLFQGPVALDAEGNAQVALPLPDFNGRLRVMALAFNDDQFGSAEQEVTVSAPIIAEMAMPRFLALGDRAELALDLRNNTEQQQSIRVTLGVSQPLELDSQSEPPSSQHISQQSAQQSSQQSSQSDSHSLLLAPGQRTTLTLPVRAVGYSGAGEISVAVQGAGITNFSRAWHLGVRPAYPAVTRKVERVLETGESLQLAAEDFSGIILDTLEVGVSVSPTVNLNLGEQLRNLLAYPYGCLEQTTSRAWPLLFATEEQQAAFAMQPLADAERLARLQKAIDRLFSFQRSNGSFGLWSSGSEESHWLTVYATDFLLHAREQGLDVPQAQLENALKRLESYIRGSGSFVGQRWSSEPAHYAFATRAYAAYVLSGLKRAPLGVLRNLYRRDFNAAQSGYAQLHLGLALQRMGDTTTAQRAIATAFTHFDGEYHYWGDYGSRMRDLGMAIYLLAAESAPEYRSQVLDFSVELRDALAARRWLSTQERYALFMAGMALKNQVTVGWRGEWTAPASAPQMLESESTWATLLRGERAAQGFAFASRHDGPLYATATVSGYGAEPPEPVSDGITIARSWYTLDGEAVTPSTLKTGERLLVALEISGRQRVADALVVNLLPAGLELENENLNRALDFEQLRIDGKRLSELQKNTDMKHREFRDDRFVAALDYRGYRTASVFFVVRAVTPGVYRVPPASVEDMYRPEIHSLGGDIEQIEVTP
ncbi:alpha-2-macroglobulin [Teredinibacter turnerae]|uniref:alpha-2-macroglobulin family protein n=1 Tax=Teredinibacter turnerae TaxID=2426 RepID=UPI0030D40C80